MLGSTVAISERIRTYGSMCAGIEFWYFSFSLLSNFADHEDFAELVVVTRTFFYDQVLWHLDAAWLGKVLSFWFGSVLNSQRDEHVHCAQMSAFDPSHCCNFHIPCTFGFGFEVRRPAGLPVQALTDRNPKGVEQVQNLYSVGLVSLHGSCWINHCSLEGYKGHIQRGNFYTLNDCIPWRRREGLIREMKFQVGEHNKCSIFRLLEAEWQVVMSEVQSRHCNAYFDVFALYLSHEMPLLGVWLFPMKQDYTFVPCWKHGFKFKLCNRHHPYCLLLVSVETQDFDTLL